MTAAPQPSGRLDAILDRVIGALAWGTQAAAATTYLIIAGQPGAWQGWFDEEPVGVVCAVAITACMLVLWALSLWEEQHRFYDRFIQRACRKFGLIGHLSVLAVATAAASQRQDRVGLWIIFGMLCATAVATWGSWMQTRFLPDEDQAVVDEILAREVAKRAAAHQAGERTRRRARLTAIVAGLGHTLTDTPQQADQRAIRWTIPAGKHAPLVYFIRNGNRIKIGTTTALKRRIRTLALSEDNVALLVQGDQRREREYHKQFAALRIGRTEWFAYEGALADYVHDQITQKGQDQ